MDSPSFQIGVIAARGGLIVGAYEIGTNTIRVRSVPVVRIAVRVAISKVRGVRDIQGLPAD